MAAPGLRILLLPALVLGGLVPAALASVDGPAVPPPPNDLFSRAQPLSLVHPRAAQWAQSTGSATDERHEPSACGALATVWFVLRPLEGAWGFLRVDTLGSDYDTVVAVYRGPDLPRLKAVACNDDAASDASHSSLTFLALPGETYHVQVGGALYATGDLRLSVRDALPPPS